MTTAPTPYTVHAVTWSDGSTYPQHVLSAPAVLAVRLDTDAPAHRPTASGYGTAPTAWAVQIRHADGRRIWHRVYALAYGNGGTLAVRMTTAHGRQIVSLGTTVHGYLDTARRMARLAAVTLGQADDRLPWAYTVPVGGTTGLQAFAAAEDAEALA